jgi:hypothetical protein
MLSIIVMGSITISSCSGASSLGAAAAPVTYRTPPQGGILCGSSGEYDFFTFTVINGIVRGRVIETDISTRAELPMNGSYKGRSITLLPLSGFGEFKGTVNANAVTLSAVNGVTEPYRMPCSLVSLGTWEATAAHATRFTSRQLDTTDFLAMTDLTYLDVPTQNAPPTVAPRVVTPSSRAVQDLSANESRTINVKTSSGYTVGDAFPQPRLSFTTGAARRTNEVSVDVRDHGYVLTLATRAADGSCWYSGLNRKGGTFSTMPGVLERSCSATHPSRTLVGYAGP